MHRRVMLSLHGAEHAERAKELSTDTWDEFLARMTEEYANAPLADRIASRDRRGPLTASTAAALAPAPGLELALRETEAREELVGEVGTPLTELALASGTGGRVLTDDPLRSRPTTPAGSVSDVGSAGSWRDAGPEVLLVAYGREYDPRSETLDGYQTNF